MVFGREFSFLSPISFLLHRNKRKEMGLQKLLESNDYKILKHRSQSDVQDDRKEPCHAET